MAGEEMVLSQAEIDALVSQAPKKPASPVSAPPAEPAPAAPPEPALAAPPEPAPEKPVEVPVSPVVTRRPVVSTASYQKYDSKEVGGLQETVSDLTRQVAKLTKAMQKLQEMEEKITQISALLKLSPNSNETLKSRFDEIHKRLDEIQMNQKGIQDEFQCSKCQAQQLVALHVKCTNCGDESWMGWWPPQNQE